MKAQDIDFIIFATLSPDYTMPGSGVLVQEKLGADTIAALDVRNQCSGFLYSLSIADQFIRTGTYDHVLVMGAEVHSTGFDYTNRGRDVTVIFGDGGGAVILGPSEDDKRGILSCHLHSEGKYFKMLWCENPASIYNPRCTHEQIEDGSVFPKMNGKVVFKHALQRFPEVINECLNANGYTIKALTFS
jgi:3-oxoacyl-[acyl-carrier-protein] synthase-3